MSVKGEYSGGTCLVVNSVVTYVVIGYVLNYQVFMVGV